MANYYTNADSSWHTVTYPANDTSAATYWITTTASASNVWTAWQELGTAATHAAQSANQLWSTWATNDLYRVAQPVQLSYSPEHAEQLRRFEDDRRVQRREADERAHSLLLENLSDEQRAEYERHRWFTVRVPKRDRSFRTFRVLHGFQGNIRELSADEARCVASYCIHPRGVPDEDTMLAQKLMLETDLANFERIANRTPYDYAVQAT